MKLLFVSQVPNSRLMGVPRVLYCVGDELERRGHTVHYFFEEDGPVPRFKQAALIEWGVRIAPIIAERCGREQYDAIVITTLSGWFLSSFRHLLLPPKTKIVSWHHGWEELMWQQMLIEEQTSAYHFSGRFKFYYGQLILRAVRQSLRTQDAAYFTSSEERDWIRSRHPQWAEKAIYLPNGVAEQYYFPERFEQPGNDGAPRLLFVGYWDPWRKGKKYLVEAFTEIHRNHPETRLTLAGTKLTQAEILPDFPESCRTAIHVIPHIDEPNLIQTYRTHDIFILPALFEGMPLVVLEAMANAMPVVTTQNNGMKDLIRSGENGLLVERRDVPALIQAVEKLIASPELRKQLGLSAFQTVKNHHTWPCVTDIFESSMTRILHRQKPYRES